MDIKNAFYLFMIIVITFPVVGKKFYSMDCIFGIVFSFIIGTIAYYLGKSVPIVGGPVFGIILGIIISFWKRPDRLNSGIKITGKKLLQAAIILLGFEMNLYNVVKVGSQSILVMISTISVCFLTAFLIHKKLKIANNTAILVSVGTCICGGSAIAATAPVIKAEDDEVATAISTIFFYNILAALIFPVLGRVMGMTDLGFGIWAGTAINDTSSVVAASYSFSDAAGELATIVKLTRTLFIIPITFVLALYTAKKQKDQGYNFSIAKIFPWFVIGFILACIVNTLGILPLDFTKFAGKFGKFMITVAMTAIGLNTDLFSLIKNGKNPLILGFICWVMIGITSLIVQKAIHLI